MAKAYRCDRCNSFYDRQPGPDKTINIRDYNEILDICPQCYQQFIDWFNACKQTSDWKGGDKLEKKDAIIIS